MRKKIFGFKFSVLLIIVLFLLSPGCVKQQNNDSDVLTIGTWRVDDEKALLELIQFYNQKYGQKEIALYLITPQDYTAATELQFSFDVGPDIIYSRSYSAGQVNFDKGYLLDLQNEPWLNETFDKGALAPWTTETGEQFAMPLLAVSHGIFYNKDLFNKLQIQIPETWEELLSTANKIKDAGYIPFGNGIKDQWDIAEVVWMSIAPGFMGGRDGRLAYESGSKRFNDSTIESIFKAIDDLQPYLPDDLANIGYAQAQDLFINQKAAMYFDGSWSIPGIVAKNPAFSWDIFTPPAPAGKQAGVCFHADAGIAINKNSPNIPEAKAFLQWLSGPEASAFIGENFPGFFPMVKTAPSLENKYANSFLKSNEGKLLDVRFTWPKLMSGSPSAYSLILNGSNLVLTDYQTPAEAADALEQGLAGWYKPE